MSAHTVMKGLSQSLINDHLVLVLILNPLSVDLHVTEKIPSVTTVQHNVLHLLSTKHHFLNFSFLNVLSGCDGKCYFLS